MTEKEEVENLKERINQLEYQNRRLKRDLEEYSYGYQHMPVGVHSLDKNGFFIRINDTELEWLGYTREEVIGKMHVRDVVAIESHDTHIYNSGFRELIMSTKPVEVRRVLRRKNGTTFPVLLLVRGILNEEGAFDRTISVIIDISKQVVLEEQLQLANEELFHLNQEKNRFIGITSHDLQNPISTISMSAELLNKTSSNLTQIQRKLIENIGIATKRMSSLIKNVLSINRIERGVIQPEFQTVNIKSCVWDVLSRFQIFANRKKITLSFKASNEDWNIISDSHFVFPIFENLISNAIKFTHEGGNVEVTMSKTGNYVSVEVKDDGQGFREEDMVYLYGRFRKLSAQPTAGELSNGLGLSIVKEYIMLLQGGIDLYSDG